MSWTIINDHQPHGKFFAPRQLHLGSRSSTTAPALSYCRPSMDICVTLVRPPRMVEVQILQEQISVHMSCAYAVSYYLPFLDVCIALISYIHVTMQNLNFLHPCRSLYGVLMVDVTGSCRRLVQPISRPVTSACLDNFFLLTGQPVI